MSLGRSEFPDAIAARSLSEISEVDAVRISADLVSAARRLVSFLRSVEDCQWLHHRPAIAEAVRRYDELWMPLISDLTTGSKPPMLLPPLDVEWVWFCHSLNPVSYMEYCQTRFSKLIGKPIIYNDENEDYAVLQCKKIWIKRYPDESFEEEAHQEHPKPVVISVSQDIMGEVEKYEFLPDKFSAPYLSENVYLVAARLRYKGFLSILRKSGDEIHRFVPAFDISFMWITHQSYPTVYAEDVTDMWEDMEKVVRIGEDVEKADVEITKEIWDRNFDQPYEKAGGELGVISNEPWVCDPPFYWPVSDVDVNTLYKSLQPRFIMEICVFVKLNSKVKPSSRMNSKSRSVLRLRFPRYHRNLKLDKRISDFTLDTTWQKVWHLYCEFGVQGVVLEFGNRRRCGFYFRSRKAIETIGFPWNDLLRAHSLALGRFIGQEIRVFTSVTPPVQASYLLKCVPDRVTDDNGTMISDSLQRTYNFRPQEGRWLTRTVLDHAGRECFVARIRVGTGVFRRGGEVPSPVIWEERVTEIREGSWSYIEGSTGKAPAKVVATVMPKEPHEDQTSAWEFSSGEDLLIRWDSSGSISELHLCSRNQMSSGSSIRLLTGRKMQYRVKRTDADRDEEDEESFFVTVVRSTQENPSGKATALIDWKHQAVEFSPEEDAVFILLLSISILRSVTEKRREDVGKLLVRRRLTGNSGERDWGSVIVDGSSSASCSVYVEPWYRNACKVLAMTEKSAGTRYPVMNYSNIDGGDNLFKHIIYG